MEVFLVLVLEGMELMKVLLQWKIITVCTLYFEMLQRDVVE